MMADEVKTMHIARGLYLLRFASGPQGSVARLDVDRTRVDILRAPGARTDLTPGRSAAISVRGETTIAIAVSGTAGAATRFSLDLHDEGKEEDDPEGRGASEESGAPAAIEVMGHLSRLGDRSIAHPGWLGGPDGPMPIEGLQIRADRGPRLHHSVRRRSSPRAWAPPDGTGFAGSRGEGDPIVGLRIALDIEARGGFEIEAEAMSLGQGIRRERGHSVEFDGPDPIVGLRLRLVEVNPRPPQSSDEMKGIVGVFRAKG